MWKDHEIQGAVSLTGRRKYLFMGLFTLSICVLALYVHRHRQGRTGYVDNLIMTFFGNLQQHSFYLVRGMESLTQRYVLLRNAHARNEELEREVLFLNKKLALLEESELENIRLRQSLEMKQRQTQPLLAARVVAHDVSADYNGLRIDRGAQDGIDVGMGVVSPYGVVGRVLRVSPQYSDVVTLVDPTSKIDAIVQRTRTRGILSGTGDPSLCRLHYVDRHEDIEESDTIVSTNFASIFPPGLLIGYVTEVKEGAAGVVQKITVRSAVDIDRLEEVFIVLPPTQSQKTS